MGFTKNEITIFWAASSVGILGGIITNFLVGYFFQFQNTPSIINLLGTIIFAIMFIFFFKYMVKQMRRIK